MLKFFENKTTIFVTDSAYQSSVQQLEDIRKRWILDMTDTCNVSFPCKRLFSISGSFYLPTKASKFDRGHSRIFPSDGHILQLLERLFESLFIFHLTKTFEFFYFQTSVPLKAKVHRIDFRINKMVWCHHINMLVGSKS